MNKPRIFTLLTVFLLIPLTLYLGSQMSGRAYYFTSTLILVEILIPFFLTFEQRKPQARELVIVAVLCALAAASRVVIPIPHFKPIFAIIMLAGVAYGAQTGFLVGAVSAFVSNFFAAQGPWTPWQMMAYGIAGLLAGVCVNTCRMPKKAWTLALFGFVATVAVVGVLLDFCTVFTSLTTIKVSSVLFILAQGLPNNLTNGLCTALTLFLLGKPFLSILDRINLKYGIMETVTRHNNRGEDNEE